MDFNRNKNLSAWDLLMLLQNRSKQNNIVIKENSELIVRLLKFEKKTKEIDKKILDCQIRNNDLTRKNGDYIKLHNYLLSFLKSIDDKDLDKLSMSDLVPVEQEKTVKIVKIYNFDEILFQTVKGEILYDPQHPYYCSNDFRVKLIEYYTNSEEYEKCAELTNLESC